MKIVCISDTHNLHNHQSIVIPDGDVLIHAGDFTRIGTPKEVQSFLLWFSSLPHKHKLVICGNHDATYSLPWDGPKKWHNDPGPWKAKLEIDPTIRYIHQEVIEIDGTRIYGDNHSRECGWGWGVSYDEAPALWKKIPKDIDILVTHGPPHGILDRHPDYRKMSKIGHHPEEPTPMMRSGCYGLRRRLEYFAKSPANRLRWHIFGHIHYSYGVHKFEFLDQSGEVVESQITCVNASVADESYNLTNPPIVIDSDRKKAE